MLALPVAEGAEGPVRPGAAVLSGASGISRRTKRPRKSLLLHLWEKDSVEQLVAGSKGYDIPAFGTLRDFKTWAEEGPPKGGIWNYPPRGEVIESVSGSPAPMRIGNQIFAQATMTKMIAQYTQQGKTHGPGDGLGRRRARRL